MSKHASPAAFPALVIFVLLPLNVLSDPPFRPAIPATDLTQFSSSIDIPRSIPEGSYTAAVRCQIQVATDGNSKRSSCFIVDREHKRFRNTVQFTLRKSTFWAAMIDDAPVKVLANLMVLFQCVAQQCQVDTFMNHGYLVEELGVDYIAPQIVVGDDFWAERWDNQVSRGTISKEVRGGFKFFVSVQVDVNGLASDPRVEKSADDFRRESELAAELIATSKFVPGHIEGRPAPMRYWEYFAFE